MADPTKPNVTVIGADTQIRGEMVFESSARILGRFEGRIASKGEVQIGESANVRASVEAETIVVDGPIEGDLTARQGVRLNARGVVKGDIVAATLTVVEGASFVGHCRVGPDALKMVAEKNKDGGEKAEPRRVVTATPVKTNNLGVAADLEATLAGLETKLAGLGKPKAAAHAE